MYHLNKTTSLFKSVISITALVGFLCIQLHSFTHHHGVHHHPDSHDHPIEKHSHHESDCESLDSESESDDHDSSEIDCLTCVLAKHFNTNSSNSEPLYTNDIAYYLVSAHFDFPKDSYFLNKSLRGPPFIV